MTVLRPRARPAWERICGRGMRRCARMTGMGEHPGAKLSWPAPSGVSWHVISPPSSWTRRHSSTRVARAILEWMGCRKALANLGLFSWIVIAKPCQPWTTFARMTVIKRMWLTSCHASNSAHVVARTGAGSSLLGYVSIVVSVAALNSGIPGFSGCREFFRHPGEPRDHAHGAERKPSLTSFTVLTRSISTKIRWFPPRSKLGFSAVVRQL